MAPKKKTGKLTTKIQEVAHDKKTGKLTATIQQIASEFDWVRAAEQGYES